MRSVATEVIRTLSTIFTLIVPFPSAWAQCSVCQAALAGAENSSRVIGGFQQGIALMFAVMGVLGVIAWRIARRARTEFGIRQLPHGNTASTENSCVPAENPASQ